MHYPRLISRRSAGLSIDASFHVAWWRKRKLSHGATFTERRESCIPDRPVLYFTRALHTTGSTDGDTRIL